MSDSIKKPKEEIIKEEVEAWNKIYLERQKRMFPRDKKKSDDDGEIRVIKF